MNFLVVVSVPFTTKKKKEALLLLKGELLKDAEASTKSLTLEEVVKKWKASMCFLSLQTLQKIMSLHFEGRLSVKLIIFFY